MLLERYYDHALAQASYLIGCDHTGEAIVIDPNVMQNYAGLAALHGMRIRSVTETHIHADYVSGSRELARETRATLMLSGHGGTDWSYRNADDARVLRDRDTINVGRVRLDVLHTPGHTPEHICFLVTDTAVGDRPMGLISGDFVFVGDVGRPDLLERAAKAAGTMEQAARQLFASLQILKDLPDYLQIWPGHGAGSACGKGLGAVPQTTLGYERLYNPGLQHRSEEAFARWVLDDQPEPPPYFATMKQWNRDGRPARTAPDGSSWMDAKSVLAAIAENYQVVDTREPALFAREHIPGTINIPPSKSSGTYAGTVLSYERPVVLIEGTGQHPLGTRAQLAMIGLDVSGSAKIDVVEQARQSGQRMASVRTIDPQSLATRANGGRVIDVRNRSEWNQGHLPNATHIYLGDLDERTKQFGKNDPIVVHCQTGTRSSIAASLLMARGFTDVTNLKGGFSAWRKAGLPISTE